jgi:hypothetical protein
MVGCSSDSRPPSTGELGDGPGAGNGSGPGGEFQVGDDALPGSDAEGLAPSQQVQCLGQTREAEAIGLDIFVMLDISGSMLDELPQTNLFLPTRTKWDAVRQSLEAFVQAPDTADIGIGLQYFPQAEAGVPSSCTSNDECGVGGPCTSSRCVAALAADDPTDNLPAFQFIGAQRNGFCASDDECVGQETCRSMLGACVVPNDDFFALPVLALCNAQSDCAGLPGAACEEIGACEFLSQGQIVPCTPSIGCPVGFGACVPFPYACLNQTRCEESAYSTPAVAISSAPTRAAEIVASLQAQVPSGLTPTGPALGGALAHARLWAEQNPGRQVVTVLATDGLPTECAPIELPEIADLARDANTGTEPVRTFVIGVFSQADLGADGQARLDTLARAGGTESAFVINTGANVADEFLSALNRIRDTAVSCEFQLDGAAALDLDRVNLRVSDALGNASELLNVGDASACGDGPGWYYVRSADGTPTQINVCPSTCAGFSTEGISAELEIGCATRIR